MFPWHQSLVLACATEPSQWEYSTRPLGLQSQSQLEIMGGPPWWCPPWQQSLSGLEAVQGRACKDQNPVMGDETKRSQSYRTRSG